MAVVEFKLGGIARKVEVQLGLAPEIEAVTQLGLVALSRQALVFELRITHAADILKAALASTGIHYTRDQVLEASAHEGPVETIENATRILNAFFVKPEGVATAKPGNARGKRPTASH